jgi:tetratricopeptide (TPR) repeat protein
VAAIGNVPVYSNPYFVNPAFTASNPYTYSAPTGLDYSQPIPLPTAEEVEKTPESTVNKAMEAFNQARSAFRKGRYAEATDLVDKALNLLPGDRSMQEFRALTLFAREKYTDAAATIHAVLASGPGWNWDTMSLLYPNEETYPKQLRALEEYTRDHPKDGAVHFLLGYHYLVLEENAAALVELRLAHELTPKDKLAPAMIEALSGTPGEAPRVEG